MTVERRVEGMWGGDCGVKCLWRKAGQPWKQGDTAESRVGGGAITQPLSLPTRQHWQLNNREAGHKMPDTLNYRAGPYPGIDHILGHKSNFSKFKKIEIISSIFSDHNAMRLDINYKGKKMVKNTNTWRLNNMFLNNHLSLSVRHSCG